MGLVIFEKTRITFQQFFQASLIVDPAIIQEDNAPSDFAPEALLRGANGVLWVSGDGRDDVLSQTHWVDFADQTESQPVQPQILLVHV